MRSWSVVLAACAPVPDGDGPGRPGSSPWSEVTPGEPSGPSVPPAVTDSSASPLEPWVHDYGPMTSIPIMGGLLAASETAPRVFVSDPVAGLLRVVDTAAGVESGVVDLGAGSVPFRVLEAEDGNVWVTLRGTGEVAIVDPDALAVVARTTVCQEPRGLDRIPNSGLVVVACASGELALLDEQGALLQLTFIAPDLRDVVVADGELHVSRFRSAEVLDVNSVDPPAWSDVTFTKVLGLAWRMRMANGTLHVVRQEPTAAEIDRRGFGPDEPPPQYYGSDSSCTGVQTTTLGHVFTWDGYTSPTVTGASVVVDFVETVGFDGRLTLAVAGATPDQSDVFVVPVDWCAGTAGSIQVDGQAESVAYDVDGRLIVQARAPYGIHVAASPGWSGDLRPIELASTVEEPPAVLLFHQATSARVACATCHAEGGDDGATFTFTGVGPRRTLSLAGALSSRAPYHWSGEIPTMDDLMLLTLTAGMGGPVVPPEEVADLVTWLDGLRPVRVRPRSTDPSVLDEGRQLFEERCEGCHSGPAYTSGGTADLGRGPFKVPTLLGVGSRQPLMHDGCAADLDDRLAGDPACTGGALHGDTQTLSSDDRFALAAFLETL